MVPGDRSADTLQVLRELLGRPQSGERPKVDVAAITASTRIDEIGLDSLTILDLIYDVEDRFQIQIAIADLVGLERVSDLIAYVDAKRVG